MEEVEVGVKVEEAGVEGEDSERVEGKVLEEVGGEVEVGDSAL